MRRHLGVELRSDEILITTGSQQALDLTGKVFLDEGDVVFCESPTYLAALSAFRAYNPRFVAVASDEDGMIVTELDREIAAHDRRKLIYVIPDFQNPSGRTWSLERRKALLEVAGRWDLPILEDAPYRELRFEGDDVPALLALDTTGHVIFTSTFSKIFSPGLRIGWVAAPPDVLDKYVLAKQGADLHTTTLGQVLISTFMQMYDLDTYIARTRAICRERRDVMIAAMKAQMPADVHFTEPQGGLFLWVELPPPLDARQWLRRCLDHGVAFPTGEAFFPNGGGENAARICFSDSPPPRIVEGVKRMAEALREVDGAESLAWPQRAAAVFR
jgi:DNA-binding transcriptional MocR family regulator